MILLNFSHPITAAQCEQIKALTGDDEMQLFDAATHFDNTQPFLPQFEELMQLLPISPEDWQTQPILVNLPALNFITALVLAELHGRMGYFPPILRTRPVNDALPPRYEVAEILNLNTVREKARARRY